MQFYKTGKYNYKTCDALGMYYQYILVIFWKSHFLISALGKVDWTSGTAKFLLRDVGIETHETENIHYGD